MVYSPRRWRATTSSTRCGVAVGETLRAAELQQADERAADVQRAVRSRLEARR